MATVLTIITAIHSCKKTNDQIVPPTLTSGVVSDIGPFYARCSVKIQTRGSGSNWFGGICFDTIHNPVRTASSQFYNGNGSSGVIQSDTFSFELALTRSHTTYFARAYVIYGKEYNRIDGIVYGNEVSFTSTSVFLGEKLWNGIVYSIDSSGNHGMLAAPEDQGIAAWYNGNYILTNASNEKDGFGNTSKIMFANGDSAVFYDYFRDTTDFAAIVCYRYALDLNTTPGYASQWYLPSKEELNIVYDQKNLIGGFSNIPYWSSTELDLNHALGQDFSNGSQSPMDKSIKTGTRAIRSF